MVQWGAAEDYGTPGDYDGDGLWDVSVWRPGPQSMSYTLLSTTLQLSAYPWGTSGDGPLILGDYDGDGKADIAVFRRGQDVGDQIFWYILQSSTGTFRAQQWGMRSSTSLRSHDLPVPADYDGDGVTDFAVQRSENGLGIFYLLQSTNGGLLVY